MDLGTVLSAAQTLSWALYSTELREALSIMDYNQSILHELQLTVETIKAVLSDAVTKQELSHGGQNYIEEIKDFVFETDDLFDEFLTLAEQQQLLDTGGSLSQKVSKFFSSKNPLSLALKVSRAVVDLRKKLDAIHYTSSQLNFNINSEPIRKRRPETCSYVNKVEIIGREHDLEQIVGMLLAYNDQRDTSILSIVGIGGLGKTALAQLVYNDPRVTNAFQLKMWTCVSDEDQRELDVKNIYAKILGQNQEDSTMEHVRSQLRAQLAGKKYLLILDDVWTEKRDQWCQLVKYLIGDKRGSWIVVTTRSKTTAKIIGGLMHELSGLSKENSWHLFERTAFSLPKPTDELVEIGQKIVDGCSGVPLAVKVVGSLLFGQDKSQWLSVQKIGLANMADYNNGIVPILKLSIHYLESPVKNCLLYCTLFPKDYVMEKAMLITLWMAQGYIVLFDTCHSIEDAAEEYFSILLRRCFFQDIKYNKFGEIESCKVHGLIYDIAQNVSGKEMYTLDKIEGEVDEHIRHLSIANKSEYDKCYSLVKTHIRSLLFYHSKYDFQSAVEPLVGKFGRLRVLDLSDKKIILLPESIGELLHLRYINLSKNDDMEALPNSITKLWNLQTLMLCHCQQLKELPKDLGKLVKLRFLDIRECFGLTSMPSGMGKCKNLNTLKGVYRVGGRGRCTSWKQWFDGLNDLKTLVNLRGELFISIRWPKNAKNDVKEDMKEGLYLRSLEHLNNIDLDFFDKEDSGRMNEDEEGIIMRVMEDLQPHANLKSLMLRGYHGLKMPRWVTLLPHLVSIHLAFCEEVEYLPCLGNLYHLKSLRLHFLPKLEYIEEEESTMLASTSTSAQKVLFFPSLEQLYLKCLPKFQGWRRVGVGMEESSSNSSSIKQCLPQLKELIIYTCPEFTCTLLCPVLETLKLFKFNNRLQLCFSKADTISSEAVAIENPENSDTSIAVLKLREVRVSNGVWLNSMPMKSFTSLETVEIYEDGEMEDLPSWIQHLSALQTLRIYRCSNLKAMPNWMRKLTSLRLLGLGGCSESLKRRCQKDPPGEDWPCIKDIPTVHLS